VTGEGRECTETSTVHLHYADTSSAWTAGVWTAPAVTSGSNHGDPLTGTKWTVIVFLSPSRNVILMLATAHFCVNPSKPNVM
jgi:hypothetical protein